MPTTPQLATQTPITQTRSKTLLEEFDEILKTYANASDTGIELLDPLIERFHSIKDPDAQRKFVYTTRNALDIALSELPFVEDSALVATYDEYEKIESQNEQKRLDQDVVYAKAQLDKESAILQQMQAQFRQSNLLAQSQINSRRDFDSKVVVSLEELLTVPGSNPQRFQKPAPQTSFPNSSNIRATPLPASTNKILPLGESISVTSAPVPQLQPLLPPQPLQQPPRVFSQTQQGRVNQFQPPIPQPSTLIRPTQPVPQVSVNPTQIPQPLPPRPWRPEDAFVQRPQATQQPTINQPQPPNQFKN